MNWGIIIEKPTVYIPIEIKNRELNSQILLGALATESGFNVYIGTHHSIHQLIRNKKDKAGLFLDKGGLSNEWASIKRKVEFLTVLDQELSPILTESNKIRDLLPTRFLGENEKLLDIVYVVGNAYFDEALKFFNSSVKIVNSGWPRIDLWTAPFSGSYSDTSASIKKKYGQFLLFSSDFGTTSESQLKTQIELITSSKSTEHERNYYVKSNTIAALSDFNKTIEILREWDNDASIPQIIVRPHPADNFNGWKKSLQGLKKTRVVHEGEINSWVEASIGVIHRGCTTALHAFILGKPVFFLEGCGNTRKSELPYLISTPIEREYKFNSFGGINHSSENMYTNTLKHAITFSDSSSCRTIIDTWLNLEITPQASVSSFHYLIHSLTLRNLRRRMGLIKWEIKWLLNATAYEPPSQALKGGIKRKDFDLVLKFLNNKATLTRIGRDLWLLAPGK